MEARKITLRIDGRPVEASAGSTVLDAARMAGIYIPSLCAHRDLKPVGACRICLVKVGGVGGFPPACTTAARDGMEVSTTDEELQRLRREILKLILLEHPSSCLICVDREPCESFRGGPEKSGKVTGCMFCSSRGGCELADVVRYVGLTELDYPTKYKNLPLEREDPFYDRDYNLCILCGRCVRMCQEVRGARAIEFAGRGIETVITPPYGGRHVDGACTFCGSCIDVCPTGTLAPRATKWFGQPERAQSSVCPHCGLGCRLMLGERRGRLVSAKPDWESPPTRGYLCAKGRFGVVELVHSNKRRRIPLVRKDGGAPAEVSWEEGTEFVAARLAPYKEGRFAALVSPDSTNEDAYVLAKFARLVMGSNSVVTDDPDFVSRAEERICERLGATGALATVGDVEGASTLLVIGGDPAATHPALEVAIKRAADRGGRVYIANRWHSVTSRRAGEKILLSPGGQLSFLGALVRVVGEKRGGGGIAGWADLEASLSGETLEQAARRAGVAAQDVSEIGDALWGGSSVLVFGYHLMRDPQALDMLMNLALLLGLGEGGRCGLLPLWQRSNAVGSAASGARPNLLPGPALASDPRAIAALGDLWRGRIPSRPGRDLRSVVEGIGSGEIRALYLTGGFPQPELLAKLECLVLQSPFEDGLERYATAVFPAAVFAEVGGTVTNIEGRTQELCSVVRAPAMSRAGWETVAEIARRMGAAGFEYADWRAVSGERREVCKTLAGPGRAELVRCEALAEPEADDRLPFLLLPPVGDLRCYNSSLAALVRGFSDIYPSNVVLLAKADLKRLSVAPGDRVMVAGLNGRIEGVAEGSADMPSGCVMILNAKTDGFGLDTTAVAVRVEKLSETAGRECG